MKIIQSFIIIILTFGCISDKSQLTTIENEYSHDRQIRNNEQQEVKNKDKSETNTDTSSLQNNDTSSVFMGNIDIDKFYPNILDTIKDRRLTNVSRTVLKPNSEIDVTILHNHGTFDQMFLCTHNLRSQLIDTYYIGKATMWDYGKSHTIESEIIDNRTIQFEHVFWGSINDNGNWTIDTTKYYVKTVSINSKGIIEEK